MKKNLDVREESPFKMQLFHAIHNTVLVSLLKAVSVAKNKRRFDDDQDHAGSPPTLIYQG